VAAATALALSTGTLPPTLNHETPDPDCDLDYVPGRARRVGPELALTNSFGLGGDNATLAMRRVGDL
jgi:3-oxoacyl-(acyl-carrier-protein) synthase